MANKDRDIFELISYQIERLFRALLDMRLMNSPLSLFYRFAFTLFGIGIIALCMYPVYQLFELYSTSNLVNATGSVVVIVTIFLCIGSYFGAYMIRSYIVHFRAQLQLRKNTVVYESTRPPLSPVESGLFIDGDWSSNETSALIFSLRAKGAVEYIDGWWWLNPRIQMRILSREEQIFVSEFFKGRDNDQQIDQHSLLYGVPYKTYSLLMTRLKERRFIRQPKLGMWSVVLFRLSLIVAVFISIIVYDIINSGAVGAVYNDIHYPERLHFWYIIVSMAVPITVIATILNGFFTSNLYQGINIESWQQVAGLKLYIKQTLAEKFIFGNEITVSSREFVEYYPYALAFGVVTLHDYEHLINEGLV